MRSDKHEPSERFQPFRYCIPLRPIRSDTKLPLTPLPSEAPAYNYLFDLRF